MSTDVSVDDRPECYWVEWNTDLEHARHVLEQRGFHGISGLEKTAVLNGNTARDKARANAIARGCMYGWVGAWDSSWIAQDSAVYFFSYSLYSGDNNNLWCGRKQ